MMSAREFPAFQPLFWIFAIKVTAPNAIALIGLPMALPAGRPRCRMNIFPALAANDRG
jgi:hypothetical protein